MEDKILNYYKFTYDGEFINGFYDVFPEQEYDFYGQMADYPDVIDSISYGGWYKFNNNVFVIDNTRKDEMIAKREQELAKPTWQQTVEAQVIYTAMMTDTLIEEE